MWCWGAGLKDGEGVWWWVLGGVLWKEILSKIIARLDILTLRELLKYFSEVKESLPPIFVFCSPAVTGKQLFMAKQKTS